MRILVKEFDEFIKILRHNFYYGCQLETCEFYAFMILINELKIFQINFKIYH